MEEPAVGGVDFSAPKAWEMRVSRPRRTPPMPKVKVLKMTWASAAAAMGTAEWGRRPTMLVSTTDMDIQPSSPAMRGAARRRSGGSSGRMSARRIRTG